VAASSHVTPAPAALTADSAGEILFSFILHARARAIDFLSMPLCAGLERLSGVGQGWARCPQKAMRGDRFCSIHRDALDGAVLGLLGHDKNGYALQIFFEEAAEALRAALGRERWRRTRAGRTEACLVEVAPQTAEQKETCADPQITATAAKSP
jgi:hypothetical protein